MEPNSSNQMEEKIQTLAENVEESIRQNEKLRQRNENAPPRMKNREQQNNNEENNWRKYHLDRTEPPTKMEEELLEHEEVDG